MYQETPAWLFGHKFMEKNYVIWDASPLEYGQDYIQVGFGDPVKDIHDIIPNE